MPVQKAQGPERLHMKQFSKWTSFPSITGKLLAWVWIIVAGMTNPAAACSGFDFPVSLITIKEHRIHVEIAATPHARACGLSHRKNLAEDRGMLFVYPTDRHLSFWMKETVIPLSIAFLDKEGRIMSIQRMIPDQVEERYRSPGPARYALEMNQDWFAANQVKVGDRVVVAIPKKLEVR